MRLLAATLALAAMHRCDAKLVCASSLGVSESEVHVSDVWEHITERLGVDFLAQSTAGMSVRLPEPVVAGTRAIGRFPLGAHLIWKTEEFHVESSAAAQPVWVTQHPPRTQSALCLVLSWAASVYPGAAPVQKRLCSCVDRALGGDDEEARARRCGARVCHGLWAAYSCERDAGLRVVRVPAHKNPCVYAPGAENVSVRSGQTDMVYPKSWASGWGAFGDFARPLLPARVPLPLFLIACGVLSIALARRLSESRSFHFALAAVMGFAAALLLASLFAGRTAKSWVSNMPYGNTFLNGITAAAAAGSVFAQQLVVPVAGSIVRLLSAFWRDGLFGIGWLGKAYFVGFALLSVLVTHWRGIGSDDGSAWEAAEEEERRRRYEEIASRGQYGFPDAVSIHASRRASEESDSAYREVRPRTARELLRLALRLTGVILISLGLGDLEVGILFGIAMFYWDDIRHFAYVVAIRSKGFAARRLVRRMKVKDYEQVAQDNTQRELEKLRRYLASPRGKDEVDRVIDSEAVAFRVGRFARGYAHVDSRRDDADTAKAPSRCTVS